MSVRIKKMTKLSHATVKLFHHILFSRVLEQVNNQEMRDRESVHTFKDSCYHKDKGAEKTWGGGGAANTSKAR